MTMPMSEDQLTRELAALKEGLADFRNEMRATLNGFVRHDVYMAQQETMRAQLTAERETLRGEVAELRSIVKRLEEDKRQNRGLVFGAFASAAVALVISFFKTS